MAIDSILLAQAAGGSDGRFVWMFLVGLVGMALGGGVAIVAARLLGSRTIGQARTEAQRLLDNANADAATVGKQAELDARNQVAAAKESADRELETERTQLKDAERRLTKREDNLDRKLDMLGTKEKYIDAQEEKVKQREEAIEGKQAELDALVKERREAMDRYHAEQKQRLLQISGLNEEEARKQALKALEAETQLEASEIIQRSTERAEEEARENAQRITLMAIQKYASEHTAESTTNAVQIPSDDMKGRIIGREGRNIRAFEKATGVDIIVDDTPGVVVVSCFDPIRRATATEALQKLLEDGRIHPTRIEELVEQVTRDMNERVVKFGKDACIETHIQGLHGRLSEMMGRLHYRTSYGQNILRHSIEVAFLCQTIANELGLDGDLARRCGFLHDIGKAMDHDTEGGHPAIGMEFARKHGEREEVLNAIGGHHNDIPSTSPYTPIVMAADAISGARPGARRETLEKYVKRLEQLEGIATEQRGVKEAYAIQAGREVRVIVDPDGVDDAHCAYVAREIAKRVSDEMTFPGEIKVTVLREMRTVEYAR
ncbi:MAG: ribonuclease Y [Planctomycetota bacterium]